MEKAFESIVRNTSVKDTTIKMYKSQLKNLYEKGAIQFDIDYGTPEAEDKFFNFIKFDPLQVIKLIMNNWTGGTQKTYVNAVIVYMRSLIQDTYEGVNPQPITHRLIKNLEIYRKVWRGKQKEYENQVKAGEMTEKQKNTFMTWEEYDDYISKAMDKYGPYSIQVLTLMLYRYQPLRADYASLEYESGIDKVVPPSGNYWTGEELVINDYKTAKTYGKIKGKVDPMLEEYINKYIEENDMSESDNPKDRSWFFPDKKNSNPVQEPFSVPISRNLLGKRIKGYFKQLGNENPPNLQQLRHIYLMNKYGEVKKSMDNDAFLMGHSKDTQNKYILNFN